MSPLGSSNSPRTAVSLKRRNQGHTYSCPREARARRSLADDFGRGVQRHCQRLQAAASASRSPCCDESARRRCGASRLRRSCTGARTLVPRSSRPLYRGICGVWLVVSACCPANTCRREWGQPADLNAQQHDNRRRIVLKARHSAIALLLHRIGRFSGPVAAYLRDPRTSSALASGCCLQASISC